MMKKILAATTAAIMCTGAGTCAFAQDADGHDGKSHMWGASRRMGHDAFGDPARFVEMLTRHLELDDSQSQTINNILTAALPEIDALRDRAQATRKAMHELDVNDADYGRVWQSLSQVVEPAPVEPVATGPTTEPEDTGMLDSLLGLFRSDAPQGAPLAPSARLSPLGTQAAPAIPPVQSQRLADPSRPPVRRSLASRGS